MFQSLMENCLGDLHLNWSIIYLDDIIVYSKTPEEHIEQLTGVFEKLSKAGLKLKLSKCEFFKERISYLGHIVLSHSIETDPKNIASVKHWPRPETVTQVRKLILGDNLKRKRMKIVWIDECEKAFQKLKELCSDTPCLAYPNYEKSFKLYTDASESGLGAVLAQIKEDNVEHPIAYVSRTLSKSEHNYDAHKLEFLALKWV